MEKNERYDELVKRICGCSLCGLCKERKNPVPGEGDINARLMIIGEGPGAQEDEKGRPFVGAAGKLLDQMIETLGLERREVYIANIVKCRPPQNRVPKPDEAEACRPYLNEQIALIDPEFILLLGSTALTNFLSKDLRITRDRGKWFEKDGRGVTATFHPAALLRDPSKKIDTFRDIIELKKKLNAGD